MKKNIRKLERMQRAATKLVPELREMNYEDRLRKLGLPTLETRRERFDWGLQNSGRYGQNRWG